MERSRFGELAMEAGYLTPERLERARRLQQQDAARGAVARPLGIICLQLGYMTFKQVSIILERGERCAGRLSRPVTAPSSPRPARSLRGIPVC